MRKYPIYLQDDEVSCGVYCIKMILKYYDIEEDTLNIKRKARIDHTGTTIKGLVETLKSYAIEAKAYHASLKDIEEHITLPCILHTIEDGIGHFVVLYEIKGDTYIIGDPAHGIVVYDQEELTSVYTENVVSITHIGRYFEYENKTFKQFLKEIKKLYHKDIRKLGSYTFFITLFSYVLSLIYASLIDYMKVKTPIVVLMIVSGAYFIIGLIKIGIEKTKEKKSILLTRAFDKEFVYTSISQVMDHKGDTGTLHPQIMDLYQLSEFCIAYFSIFYVDLVSIVLELLGLLLISTQLSLVLIIVLVILGIFVYFKSKHFIELYKDYIAAHIESEHALIDYLDQREIGKRYYGKHQWLKRYEHYYENEANHKQDQEEFSLTLSTGMHMIQILGEALILFVGLFLYHNKSITMGELILFYMVYNMILIPLIHLCTTLVEYSQSTVLYEKYKELTTPVVQGKLLVEEPIHTIYMNNVSYAYGFHEPVLNHLDLEINHSFFIFGDNGSGKSTIMKCIAGLYHPTSGGITINGYDIDKDRVNALSNMGVSIEYPALYPNLTGKDHFKMVAKWKKLDKSRIKEMEDFSGLNSELKKEVRHYSMGMKQRLILSLAMMTKPKLLILDEPTNGLDPQAIIDLRKKLLDIRNDGTSILLSSHQLSEVDKLVDRIIFIKDGQLIAHKTIDELHQKHISCIKTSDNRYAQKILKDYIVTNDNEYIRLECGSDNDFSKVINLLVENNISIYSIEDKGEGLEKYYQNLYQG